MIKKIFSALLAALILAAPAITAAEIVAVPISAVLPASEFDVKSESSEKELTAAILTYKKTFGSTDDYDYFYHYINDYNGVKIYKLQWENENKGISVYADVGTDGVIYSYNQNNDFSTGKELSIPTIYKDQALETAYDFIKTNFPDIIDTISKDYADITLRSYQDSYNITFYRVYKDMMVNDERIEITVNYDRDITRFSRYSFSNNVSLPEKLNLIDKDEIISIFNKNMPLELVYRTIYPNGYGNGKAEVKLYYRPASESYSKFINAETGEVLSSTRVENVIPQASNEEAEAAAPAEAAMGDSGLTPEEISAVEMQKSFVTVDDITKILLAVDEIVFNDEYYSVSSYLYKTKSVYTNKETYIWNVTYRDKYENNVYAAVNAATGEIISYSQYKYYADPVDSAKTEPQHTQEDAAEKAAEFFNKYYGEIFSEYEIREMTSYSITPYTSYVNYPTAYYVYYDRYVNGIQFSDTISVSLDPDTLEIKSFNVNYSDAKFPSVDKVITAEKAADKYWNHYGLTPSYLPYEYIKGDIIYRSVVVYSSGVKELLAVYKYSDDGGYIDALTGKVVNGYNGKEFEYTPHKYYTSKAFTDIAEHKYEKEIFILTQIDIIRTDKDVFEPDSPVSVNDFNQMIASIGYGTTVYDSAALTREKAIKALISKIGYGEVAELKGIFDVSYFSDADKISDDLKGYIAIAKGMGLLDTFGEKLSPKSKLTNAEAAYLTYTYLIYFAGLTN